MENEVSRRSFIEGAALAGVGAAALASGVTTAMADEAAEESSEEEAASAEEETETSEDWLPASWDYECDFLVIGYGGAGLWAALTAADEGESEVLCLEKAPVRGGGNTSINMGEFTYTDDPDGLAEYITGFSEGLISETMAQTWAEEASHNFEYAEKWGCSPVKLDGTMASAYTQSCEYPEFDVKNATRIARLSENGNSSEGWAILDQAREDLGVEVIFDCHDETLIQNPDTKEIYGCYTYIGDDEVQYAVKARKATLLSTGGFEFNEEMHSQYLKCYPCRGFYGWPFNEGDGHRMALEVGAKLRNMGNFIGSTTTNFPNNDYKYAIDCSPDGYGYIKVDRTGVRFADETGGFDPHNGWHPYVFFDDDICGFSRIPTWTIFDSKGIVERMGPLANSSTMSMYLEGLPEECGAYGGWSEDNSVELELGWIKQGDTLEELIEDMANPDAYVDDKMDIDNLTASIERWNEICAAGEDTDFGRDSSTLVAIDEPPYYAVANYPGGCTTLGGPDKNENAQVLDGKGEVIPRLYAAGSISNFQEHTYGISGGGNAENMVWGRIAARHGCALEPWDE